MVAGCGNICNTFKLKRLILLVFLPGVFLFCSMQMSTLAYTPGTTRPSFIKFCACYPWRWLVSGGAAIRYALPVLWMTPCLQFTHHGGEYGRCKSTYTQTYSPGGSTKAVTESDVYDYGIFIVVVYAFEQVRPTQPMVDLLIFACSEQEKSLRGEYRSLGEEQPWRN